MSNEDVLHIVFGYADGLREALREAGRRDRVIRLVDDLSYGPIDPSDPETRHRWVATELGFTGWPETGEGRNAWIESETEHVEWEDVPANSRSFWATALAPHARKILWVSRRNASDCCGYLEWLSRAGDMPCEVVDLTEIIVPRRETRAPMRVLGLATVWAEDFQDLKLLDRAKPLQSSARQRDRDLWGRLRAENAPFRIISGDRLVSAPITAFDDLLLSGARAHSRKIAMMVGRAMSIHHESDVASPHEMVFAARIKALIEAGRLELKGYDPFMMRFCEVGLPPRDGFSVAPPDIGP